MDWSLEVQVIVKREGDVKSITSHEIFNLDNASADAGGEALFGKVVDQIHEWQQMKSEGKLA